MPQNVYIHIPFCKSKCNYCSFVSFTDLNLKSNYLYALIKEIKWSYKNEKLKTLYFGGGTPSLLSSAEFQMLTDLFNTDKHTEITVEINPETVSEKFFKELKNVGINRLSLGCQTFNDKILKLIARRHTSADVENSIALANAAGFENINIDLIYGLPEQTLTDFENDLNIATKLNIHHISLYGLKIDNDCYFDKYPPKNLPDDDMQAEMYLKAIEILSQNGFKHYEISNFAKKGFESKHNLNYWDNNTYYGFGVSAHGYENGIRYNNTAILKDYIKAPYKHENHHKLTFQEQLEEEIFLGFRKTSGINVKKINKKFNINFLEKYGKTLKKYVSYKYLKETNDGFTMTDRGFLISNIILSEFIE